PPASGVQPSPVFECRKFVPDGVNSTNVACERPQRRPGWRPPQSQRLSLRCAIFSMLCTIVKSCHRASTLALPRRVKRRIPFVLQVTKHRLDGAHAPTVDGTACGAVKLGAHTFDGSG